MIFRPRNSIEEDMQNAQIHEDLRNVQTHETENMTTTKSFWCSFFQSKRVFSLNVSYDHPRQRFCVDVSFEQSSGENKPIETFLDDGEFVGALDKEFAKGKVKYISDKGLYLQLFVEHDAGVFTKSGAYTA